MSTNTRAQGSAATPQTETTRAAAAPASADSAIPAHTPVVPIGAEMLVADVMIESKVVTAAPDPLSPKAARKLRVINLLAVTLPLLGFAGGMYMLWGTALNGLHLAIMAGMAVITGLGITIGFHRLFTHRAFVAPAWIRYFFAVAGSMAVQGSVIGWAADHRRHHQFSDDEGDPHSPHMGPDGSWGEGIWATLRGAYHSHVGWLLMQSDDDVTDQNRYVRDLLNDRLVAAASRQFVFWVFAGLALPALVGGLVTMTWTGALLGFLWGGLTRVLIVHHVTWSVNSICHLWGTQPFRSHDQSRNNLLVGILAMGEGWHNNHHAFPSSARHGLRWWEFDLSWVIIWSLGKLGLAKDIRLPDAERMEAKKTR